MGRVCRVFCHVCFGCVCRLSHCDGYVSCLSCFCVLSVAVADAVAAAAAVVVAVAVTVAVAVAVAGVDFQVGDPWTSPC